MSKLPGANTFKNFFDEPQRYPDGEYVFAAKDQAMLFNQELAIRYFVDWLMEQWQWIPRENRKYVFYEVRKHISSGFVKWHGGIDDDGNMGNAWWLYHEWKGNQKGFKHVWVADFQKHYIQHGHHFDPIVSDWGMQHGGSNDCVMCGRLKMQKVIGGIEELNAIHRTDGKDLPKRDFDNVSDEAIDERVEELEKELGYYDSYK